MPLTERPQILKSSLRIDRIVDVIEHDIIEALSSLKVLRERISVREGHPIREPRVASLRHFDDFVTNFYSLTELRAHGGEKRPGTATH